MEEPANPIKLPAMYSPSKQASQTSPRSVGRLCWSAEGKAESLHCQKAHASRSPHDAWPAHRHVHCRRLAVDVMLIQSYLWHILMMLLCHPDFIFSSSGYVPHPWEGLVPALLYDLQVAHLQGTYPRTMHAIVSVGLPQIPANHQQECVMSLSVSILPGLPSTI